VFSALTRGAVRQFGAQHFSIVAAGKAAWPMAVALESVQGRALLGRQSAVTGGLVAGPRFGPVDLLSGPEWFDASHPSPNDASESAGRRALALAADTRPGEVLLVLLSGGASSMLAVPAPGISLADKVKTGRALMNAGVPIADLNCVRKHLSAIKGGRLAALAPRTVTLAISDVHGPVPDDPAVIGSGPTVADPTTYADALDVVRRAGIEEALPPAVIAHLQRGDNETPKPGDPRVSLSSFEVIGDRHMAMEGAAIAARARGYAVRIVKAATCGEARDAGEAFAAAALREGAGEPLCVIASGETTVHVCGSGRGGRNQEFALGALGVIDSAAARGARIVLGSAGTDGIDGPTDAAGAIVDGTTSLRAGERGLEAATALATNGAYDYFMPLGDLVTWGPTGTNVGDLHVLVIHPRGSAC
jgi:glycerate 2-kinase